MRLVFTDMAREAKSHIDKCYNECCDILRKYGSMRICQYWSSLPDHKAEYDIMVYIPNFDGGLDFFRTFVFRKEEIPNEKHTAIGKVTNMLHDCKSIQSP